MPTLRYIKTHVTVESMFVFGEMLFVFLLLIKVSIVDKVFWC